MVGNILHLMLSRGISIIRWNNFPRVVDIKQMDNVGMTLHTALFFAHHSADSSLDELYIMKKILFMSLADLILSDINSGTKSYIKQVNPEIFDELYGRAYNYFLQKGAPEIISRDFREVISSTDKKREDDLILAAKKYVGHFEAQMNARVFPEIYEVPLGIMKNELDELASRIPELAALTQNQNHEKYLAHIYRLSFSMRWNQYRRILPISVMSHKVIVAYLSYVIGMLGNQAGESNDIRSMMLRAIYHDVPEVITGDIITPTKRAVPGFVEVLEEVESVMLDDYLFGYISENYKEKLSEYILHPFHDEEGRKVKYADVISALLESKIESDQKNSFFHEKYAGILRDVSKFSHPGVEFLLREIMIEFASQGDESIG